MEQESILHNCEKSLDAVLDKSREYADRLIKILRKESYNVGIVGKFVDSLVREFCEDLCVDLEVEDKHNVWVWYIRTIKGEIVLWYNESYYSDAQLLHYFQEFGQNQSIQNTRTYLVIGVSFNSRQCVLLHKKDSYWIIKDVTPTTELAIRRLFYMITQILPNNLDLNAENLAYYFSPNQLYVKNFLRTLFHICNNLLDNSEHLVSYYFEKWKIFFGQSINPSEAFSAKKLSVLQKWIIRIVGDANILPKDIQKFLFVLHTYFALLVKLLVWLVLSRLVSNKKDDCIESFDKLSDLKDDDLISLLKIMEQGIVFENYGLSNLLELNFFSWYLEVLDNDLISALRDIILNLNLFNPVSFCINHIESQDIFKKFYQRLLPRDVRHSLGEYYTPNWLAEYLLSVLEPEIFSSDTIDNNQVVLNEQLKKKILFTRFLDPSCGSGTFLVLIIRRLIWYAERNQLSMQDFLKQITNNVVGIDINPLAVLMARANYVFSIVDLLDYRMSDLEVPVYIADSVRLPVLRNTLIDDNTYDIDTEFGNFSVPEVFLKSNTNKDYTFSKLCKIAEESLKSNHSGDTFLERVRNVLIDKNKELSSSSINYTDTKWTILKNKFYEPLLALHKNEPNNIWIRVLKNIFTLAGLEKFDYIVGNPPWINWANLPSDYRTRTREIWNHYRIIGEWHGGRARLGAVKVDISALMTYVVADKMLKLGGRLGFIITQSLLKTAGAGAGFRRFRLPDSTPLKVLRVEDFVAVQPFDGASTHTILLLLEKGNPTEYPVPYFVWRVKNKSKIESSDSLQKVIHNTHRMIMQAIPVKPDELVSPLLTAPKSVCDSIQKIIGSSSYIAHSGACTGGLNALYWVEVIEYLPKGDCVIRNITDKGKVKIAKIEFQVESGLLYPLLRWRDVRRWKAQPSAWIIVPQDPSTPSKAYSEEKLQAEYPKTYSYLKIFEDKLRERSGYKQISAKRENEFYGIIGVGHYTFTEWKVVWTRIGKIEAAVVGKYNAKPVIPQDTITFIACNNEDEAHYIAAIINSTLFQIAVSSYSQKGGKSMGATHILDFTYIPQYDPSNPMHIRLAKLSAKAHIHTLENNLPKVIEIENEVDKVVAQIFSLSDEEVYIIRQAKEVLK